MWCGLTAVVERLARVRVRTRAWVVLQRHLDRGEVDTFNLLIQGGVGAIRGGQSVCMHLITVISHTGFPVGLPLDLVSLVTPIWLWLQVSYKERNCTHQCRPRIRRRRPHLLFTDSRHLRLRQSPPYRPTYPKTQKPKRIAAEHKKANVSSLGNGDAASQVPRNNNHNPDDTKARTARDDRTGADSSVHNCTYLSFDMLLRQQQPQVTSFMIQVENSFNFIKDGSTNARRR